MFTGIVEELGTVKKIKKGAKKSKYKVYPNSKKNRNKYLK